MCGIIGYIGLDNSIPDLIFGIKKLEYRGYDSFGCAIKTCEGLKIFKTTEKIEDAVRHLRIDDMISQTAIFHTRWATNGKINEVNAHPQLDCKSKIAVVHNGIIDNAEDLKKKMYNHLFLSDTDTEIIPHIIEDNMSNGKTFFDSVLIAARSVVGMSSFVVLHADIDEMIGVKIGSSLILAIDKGGYFISSDIPSVLRRTNKIIYLSDGDVVHLTKNSYSIVNIYGINRKHEIKYISTDLSSLEDSKFPHVMLKEIYEQLSIWKELPDVIVEEIKKASDYIRKAERVFFVGSGSSYHVSLYGSILFRKCGKDSIAIQPQEISDFKNVLKERDLLIVISQSGETADLIYYLNLIPKNKKVGIINVEQSFLAKSVDLLIPMSVGSERAVAATKSVSNSLIIVSYMYLFLSGNVIHIERDAHLLELNKFNLIVPSIENKINEISNFLKDEDHLFVTGTGKEFILAMEGALKIKEVTYIHAEALDIVSLKHGPLAMVEPGTKVIAIVGNGDNLRNIDELKARGAIIIGISEERFSNFDYFIRSVPAATFSFAPILFILQLLSYNIAVKKGLNPDKPRNLAKSVTVR
jgi:glucosamine--fructose-6-phosphate aminotransferase (isomerizing)